MPREQRKRGKKHKKAVQEAPQSRVKREDSVVYEEQKPAGEPSWIVPAVKPEDEEINPEAPFGYVDADVKAYFRTVDTQIRTWQENGVERAPAEDENDPNEEKRLFFIAALNEMRDKEKQMATDPDCSVILERMAYSMDDFVRRVFMDSLAGSYEALFRHRFASHVCQTLLLVARDSIAREVKGIIPSIADSSEQGELRSMTHLVLDICEEILPNFPSMFIDPFASHVLRSLLLLLCPSLSSEEENSESALRSKKSAAWKAKQGQMKSLFAGEQGKGKVTNITRSPPAFQRMAGRFVEELRSHLDENEIRAMAANKVACPGLQLLLQVESDQNMTNQPDSLMDRVMVGVISTCHNGATSEIVESDYLGTLLRDPTSSHLLEVVASRCPDDAFYVLWNTYFKGKLPRLAIHPVANFVLAKAMERVTEGQLLDALTELESIWSKSIKLSRTGVLRTVIERAATFSSVSKIISDAMYHAFKINAEEERGLVVPCILVLLPLQEYKALPTSSDDVITAKANTHHRKRQEKLESNGSEPTIQGSLLLQSLLRLPEPHNQFIIDSILSLPIDQRIKIAHHPSGSRIYDVLLDSKTVPAKAKRQFIIDFLGSYHRLVDDKIGSRVGDRCWEFCDTYLKEKIARSLIPEEQALAASYYGKFFARNLNLYLLQRRPQDWRNLQSERKRSQQEKNQPYPSTEIQSPHTEPSPRKRKFRPDDEIDALFDAKLGKQVKKATLADVIHERPHPSIVVPKANDDQLQQIFHAIEAAPKSDGYKRKKKKT